MNNSSASNPARATNARRDTLKSLLALASGAASLGALAPAMQAGIVYTPFTPPKTVGWGAGQLPTYTFNLPGGASIILNRDEPPSGSNTDANRIVAVIAGPGGQFANQASTRSASPNPPGVNVALRTAYGQNWNNAVRSGAGTFGNIILSSTASNFINGPGAFSSMKYLLFQFENGSTTDYGWIGMSEATYTGDKIGMSVTFTGIAYEDSGAVINAGDMGASPVPEASTGVVSALVASLVVGSESLRRWRKAKPVKVSQPA